MSSNKSIFKSYDIRGIYPSELNEEAAFKIGQAFAIKTGAKEIAVCRDGRLSSQALFSELARGITSLGANVYNLGQAPTECLYFAVANYKYGAGIMITASHNPKEYNGFKMIKNNSGVLEVISGKELLEDMEKEFSGKARPAHTPQAAESVAGRGEVKEINFWDDYLAHIFSFADISKIEPFRIVVDSSNGVASKVISKIAPKLPIEIISLNSDIDGNFPNHSPNPLLEGSAMQIKKEILNKKVDFGFIFDGDADRIFLVDERGNLVKGDVSLLILADYFLKKRPGSAVAFNAVCSKAVPELILKWGGKPVRTRVGSVFVRDGLMREKGVVSGEVSGHFSFKDNYYMDSGFIAFLILLQAISNSGKKVSEITKETAIYFREDEINFKVQDKEKVLEKIKKDYSDGEQDFLDGITVSYKDWWFNARPSNTEPLLRVTIEADTKKLLEKKKKEIKDFIKEL